MGLLPSTTTGVETSRAIPLTVAMTDLYADAELRTVEGRGALPGCRTRFSALERRTLGVNNAVVIHH